MHTSTVDPRVGRLAEGARTAAKIAAIELRLFLRDPGTLVGLVGFPAVTVLVLAGVFGSTPDPEFGGVRPSEHYVVGYVGVVLAYVGVVLAYVGLVALPVHVASRRELGVVRRYRASGASAVSMLCSHAAVGSVVGIVGGGIVLLVGGLVYGVPVPDNLIGVLGWFVAGLLCFVALGIALGTLLPSSRTANAVGNLLFVPMFLLGGGGPPRDVMTDPMRVVSDLLPISHVIGGLRLSWLGASDDPRALWWTVGVTALAVALAIRVEKRRVV